MPIFAALLGPALSAFTGGLLDRAEGLFQAYLNKEITREQLAVDLQKAVLATFADVEKAYAQSLSATFASFMEAASKSRLMQATWAAAALSQLFVLIWYQFVVPAIVTLGWVKHYASAGATVDYAYFLLALCLGGGAIALKAGPGAGALTAQIKNLVKS